MWDEGERDEARRAKAALIDVTVPNAARVGNFLYGGRDNFESDRKAVRALIGEAPAVREIPASARAFRLRSVRYLAAEAGIRQFLDIGTGLVPPGNTHEVAQAIDPACRIVYVDSDPMVLAHARAMLRSAPGGVVSCVDGDISNVAGLIKWVTPPLDLDRPVAVMLLSTLAAVASAANATEVVSALMAAVPSGSYLVVYHLASDLDPALTSAVRRWNSMAPRPITLRSRAEIAAILSGFDVLAPGVVPVNDWRPDPGDAVGLRVPVHGAVVRKP